MKTNLLSKVAALTVALCFTGTMSVFADDPFTERTTGGVIYRVYSDHAVAADVDTRKRTRNGVHSVRS